MPRRLWVVGDSWTDPAWGGWGWEAGWPTLVARRLGLDLVNSGKGGSGYVNVNGAGWTYPREVELGGGGGADAVIVWGSINDAAYTGPAVQAAAARTLAAIRAACPEAVLLVYGPQYWDTPPWPGLAVITAAVRAAAQAAGAVFVDPLLWMQGRADLIDGTGHPNQAGHRLLADRIDEDLLFAMGPERASSTPSWDGGYPAPWTSPYAAAAATLLEDA
jgi:lysophospholipase L1-like esterase